MQATHHIECKLKSSMIKRNKTTDMCGGGGGTSKRNNALCQKKLLTLF